MTAGEDAKIDNVQPKSEEVLLAARLLAGDTSAFDRFVEIFHHKLFRYTLLTCGQREDAEDVAQETLLKVFESLNQLREPERIKPWVFTIARNVCYMKRRKSIFAPEEEISLDQLMPSFSGNGHERKLEIADWSQLPETQAMNGELRSVLHEAIHELPELYRSTLLLRDLEGLTTEETAEILGVGTDAVKTRLHRARLMMRKKLDKQLNERGTLR